MGAAPSSAEDEPAETVALRRRVQDLRVMLLRITARLGVSSGSSVVQQVLMRLDMAERIRLPRRSAARTPATLPAAQAEATSLEGGEGEAVPLPFTCTVMLLGLTGGGKSSIINALLGREECAVSPFESATKKVQVVEGSVRGVNMRFIDTPGLQLSPSRINHNAAVLAQAKAASKGHKPDIVLWVDRMDVLRRMGTELPVLQQVSAALGNATWFNTVLVMTHAAKPPPDGPSGAMAYDAYINHRMSALQQGVRAAAKDFRLMNPAALAECHPNCRTDGSGEPILPNGTPWRQQLLMLGLSSKLLVDAEKALDIQKAASSGAGALSSQLANFRPQKLPPIPYLLSNMIQARKPYKVPEEEAEVMSDREIASEPDPMVKKYAIRSRRAFLNQRDQERREDEEGRGQGPVAIPGPELPLQPSFDAELGYNRYLSMDAPGGWIAQPHVEPNSVEHDDGVEGVTVQREGMLRPPRRYLGGFPAHFHAQVHADKSSLSVISDAGMSLHHTRKVVSTVGVEAQTVGGDHLWVVRGETRAKGLPLCSRAAAGMTAARLVDGGGAPLKGPLVYGAKLENRVRVRRGTKANVSAGMMTLKGGKEVGYAGNARLSSLLGLDDSTHAMAELSLMSFRKDTVIGGNCTLQTPVTPETQVTGRVSLNTKGSGALSMRVVSHDKGELVYAFVPTAVGWLIGYVRKCCRGEEEFH